jgi:hypothetical protein
MEIADLGDSFFYTAQHMKSDGTRSRLRDGVENTCRRAGVQQESGGVSSTCMWPALGKKARSHTSSGFRKSLRHLIREQHHRRFTRRGINEDTVSIPEDCLC